MAAPRLALAEMLVWASAFAKTSTDLHWAEEHPNRAVEAVKAAFNAVDLLRASQDLIALTNRKYADETKIFNELLARGVSAKDAPKMTAKHCEDRAIDMLRAFLISDGKPQSAA